MSQISNAIGVDNAVNRESVDRFSEMQSEDFIKIMFTELTNQDPLSPNDSAALLDQISSIRSIESDMALGDQLEKLVTENQLAGASAMIGKFIGGRTEDFGAVSGYVVSVIRQGDAINLELDTGFWVPMENVETVLDPTIFDQPEEPEDPGEPGEGQGEEGENEEEDPPGEEG